MKGSTHKFTGRDFQRSLFIGSLADQLNRMAVASHGLEALAEEYLSQGLKVSEVEELLIAEGHDPDLARSLMSCKEAEQKAGSVASKRWGYRLADSYGRIVSHIEVGAPVEASTEEEAQAEVAKLVGEEDAGFKSILEVFELEE